MEHCFVGKWITDDEFFALEPRNVFHRALDKVLLPCDEHRNRHILFRRAFSCDTISGKATVYISADDYYKLYINGQFVAQGPAPSYHFRYNYNEIDVTAYLKPGKNVIAVHTLYQGLINRVWQSGDNRHGMILDLMVDDTVIVASNESFKTCPHSAYTETGICGYDTQFLERYDSNAREVGFESVDFDDRYWQDACVCLLDDHEVIQQKSAMLTFENKVPICITEREDHLTYDFGSIYVGYLCVKASGQKGQKVVVRCAQELREDGTLRVDLRANCYYEEEWILSEGENFLDWFDYKSFRYAELTVPAGVEIHEVFLLSRHYPFVLNVALKPTFSHDERLKKIWELCVRTQQYGVQEVIQDCMEREKGFYLGDGCYTALTHMLLTGDDSMVRCLIDDAFSTDFIADTLVTCMNCSVMQEIAEYPLILVYLVLWHYRYTGDIEYLRSNYEKTKKLLNAYRHHYEKEYLLRDIDKWCVVEWPQNFQHGYDVDVREGIVCKEAHISINAYYIKAIKTANKMAQILCESPYRHEEPLLSAFISTFYNHDCKLFKDGENTEHISLVGNTFVYGFDLYPNQEFEKEFLRLLDENGIHSLSLFCVFPILMRFAMDGNEERIRNCLLDDKAWLQMLREDATTTFEGWSRDSKWNTSLFHLTMSYAAAFMVDLDIKKIFER